MARPRLQIDPTAVEKLASIGCTVAQIGHVLGCSKDTLERRYAAAIEKGREKGNVSLLKRQFDLAMSGDRTMLIWLGKVRLQQKEVQVVETRELPQVVIE